jgi:predicted acyltransferase
MFWERLDLARDKQADRVDYLDLYRGVLISIMIFVNTFLYFETLPSFLKHASPGAGMSFVDLGAPIFFFILGVSYSISFERRVARQGTVPTIRHFLFRYFLFWVFGLTGAFFITFRLKFGWNVLMAIGLAGIVALPFMLLKPIGRFLVGIALLLLYQFVVLRNFGATVLAYDMGGYAGALSWGGLILISSIWWPILKSKDVKTISLSVLGLSLGSASIGFALSSRFLPSKLIISLPYILISYGVAVLGLFFFLILERHTNIKSAILKELGRSAILIYMLSSVLSLAFKKSQKTNLAMPGVFLGSLGIYSICLIVAAFLHRKKLIIKI